jgi:hypothetical protein
MSEELKYKKGIVTFLDFLGWRNLLATKQPAELAQALAVFRKAGDPKPKLLKKKGGKIVESDEDDEEWASMYEYAALSDCVFRCTEAEHKVNKQLPHGQLFHELISLVFVQTRLFHEGYLIRGAVTYGKYYGSRDLHGSALFGPAIARAYEIETELANYPRIVIDPVLIAEYFDSKILKSYQHSHTYEWTEYLQNFLRRDESGVWYLDYLPGYIGAVGEPGPVLDFFNAHKALVESNLAELLKKDRPYPDRVTDKWLWLLRYHNSTMNRVTGANWQWMSDEDYTTKRDDFLVDVPDHPIFKEYEQIIEVED